MVTSRQELVAPTNPITSCLPRGRPNTDNETHRTFKSSYQRFLKELKFAHINHAFDMT